MSTGIGFGIALPHASSRVAEEPVAAFGLSRKGVKFDSLDGLPANFIFLFVVPWRASVNEHTKVLGRIANAVKNHKTLQSLRSCVTVPEIKAILDRFFAD
jgi:mannitol/fructose-specific phosphotransferase system IIA component (Ntr-type)